MRPKARRRRSVTVLLCGLALLIGLLAVKRAGYRINVTASLPVGIWRLKPSFATLHRGQIITVCPPASPVFAEAKNRGYLFPGDCPGGVAPLLKPIAAVEGDAIETKADGLYVNGKLLPNSKSLTADSSGRPLHPVMPPYLQIPAEHVLLIATENDRSFDGRYFGPISLAGLQGTAEPVFMVRWRTGFLYRAS